MIFYGESTGESSDSAGGPSTRLVSRVGGAYFIYYISKSDLLVYSFVFWSLIKSHTHGHSVL